MSDETNPVVETEPMVEPVETAPLFLIKGDATPEEVAALVAVLNGVASGAAPEAKALRPEWSAPHRTVRRPLLSGPGGWRSSSMPR